MSDIAKFARLTGFLLMLFAGLSCAQQVATGKYTGSISGERKPVGVTFEVKNADNGKISGTVTTFGRGGCAGAIDVEGTYEGGKMLLQSAAGRGATKDCGDLKLELAVDGSSLKGRFMGENSIWRDVQLSR